MERRFPPPQNSAERDGWDKCMDTPPHNRKRALRDVTRQLDHSGERKWARGWMDCWDTIGEKDWAQIPRSLRTSSTRVAGKTFRFVVGEKYKVTKSGVRLDWWEAVSGGGFRGKAVRVPVGTVLTYTGSKMGIGSDNIEQDTFRWDKKRVEGSFGPSFWGSADKSYLEPVSGGRMSNSRRLLDLAMKISSFEKDSEKWIQDAVKKPGRVHDLLSVPEEDDIPMGKIDAAISKLKKKDTRTKKEQGDLKALQLAKTLKSKV